MVKLSWHSKPLPEGMEVRQVYGVVFTEDGRTLIRIEYHKNGKVFHSLAGGTPEDFDKSMEDTLRREFIEEVNTTLGDEVYYLGYQLVENDGKRPPYAQVRMTAMIKEIGEKKPDPDGGEIYDRLLTSPEQAIKRLNWGEPGEQMVREAFRVAKEKFNLTEFSSVEEYV